MNTVKKRNALCYVMLVGCMMTVVSFLIYSCSTDDCYSGMERNQAEGMGSIDNLPSIRMKQESTLIDSIAASDEFWEFKMKSQLLADKFHAYTSTLSQEGYDKLMEELNNDDYINDFIEKASLEKELHEMEVANQNLISHTGFLRLSDDERMQLFMQYAENVGMKKNKLLKTRQEGGEANACEKQKEEAYALAKADYYTALAECITHSSSSSCKLIATSNYNKKLKEADNEYKDCIAKS